MIIERLFKGNNKSNVMDFIFNLITKYKLYKININKPSLKKY